MRKFIILSLLVGSFLITPLYSQSYVHLYSTWNAVEFDTCASAWLIKRFIDKSAQFKFFPNGELITEGIAFDTPDAEIRRQGNMSAYEVILQKYKIKDPTLIEIGKIVHEIEVAYWGETSQISKGLGKKIMNIINKTEDKQECFQKSFEVFDDLYEKMKKQ